MPNRFLRAIAALSLCLSLSACGLIITEGPGIGQGQAHSTTGAGATTETPYTAPTRPDAAARAEAELAALPKANFEGLSFIVATAGYDPLFPSAGERLDDRAKLTRNAAVRERYNVSFIPAASTVDAIYNETLAAENSGMYYADLLVLPAGQVGRFAAAGLLRNLHNLPFWDNTAAAYGTTASAGGANLTTYADLGAAVLDHDRLPAIFFNRTLAESLGYDLYGAVESGEWTWELYLQAAAAAASADGAWGHTVYPADENIYSDLCAGSFGIQLLEMTEGKAPVLTVPESIARLDTLLRSLRSETARYPNDPTNALAPLQSFSADSLLFCCADLEYMDWLYDAPAKWGILPLPGSGDGHYRSPTGADAPVLCVTAANNKFEQTGLILAALNAASTDVITDAYITERLQNRLRDWESAAMIELIAETAAYDLPTLYTSGMPSLGNATIAAVREAAAGGAPLGNIITNRAYYANVELSRLFG